MKTHVKSDHAIAPTGTTDPVVVCQLPSGGNITTTLSECLYTYGGRQVGDIRDPVLFDADALFLYRLPSGNKVVGTDEQRLADRGTLVEGFDSRETTPSGDAQPEHFICRLPSGLGIVATFDQCQQDGGMIVGKIVRPSSED